MTTTVTGLYDNYDEAEEAVAALEAAGIPSSDISIVANNGDDHHADKAAEDAGEGAGIGAAVGGVGGLLTGLGIMAIPGVGPVVAAGWLAATAAGAVTGAVVGGAAGGIIGAMTKSGIPEQDAHVYAEGVRRGGTLLSARVDESQAANARSIIAQYRNVDIAQRRTDYQSEGWTRFDEGASPLTQEKLRETRNLPPI